LPPYRHLSRHISCILPAWAAEAILLCVKNLSLNVLIAVTGIGFSLLAFAIDLISEKVNLTAALRTGADPWFLPVVLLFITPIAGLLVHYLMEHVDWFRSLNQLNRSMIRQIDPSTWQVIMLSLAAGWGEEILFRGAFQPIIGIIPTSLFFAGLHTGFRFNLRALQIYFLMVFCLSIGLGIAARRLGLISAMTIHASWDLAMLWIIRRELANETNPAGGQPYQHTGGSGEEDGIVQDGIHTVSE